MIRAVVFDFDGLILETETAAYTSWAEIYREHGHELPLDRWFDYIGRGAGWFDVVGHLGELVGERFDATSTKARRTARRDEIVNALDLMAGVRDYIDGARRLGLRVGIASSSSRGWVCGHLERLAVLEGWDAIVCREDVEHAKPSPDLYLKAVSLLAVEPTEAIALEDSPNGVAAAKAAGLRCVAVPNALTADLDLRQADIRIASLADVSLDELIRRLEERATSHHQPRPRSTKGTLGTK